jgi:hypothetical protein
MGIFFANYPYFCSRSLYAVISCGEIFPHMGVIKSESPICMFVNRGFILQKMKAKTRRSESGGSCVLNRVLEGGG